MGLLRWNDLTDEEKEQAENSYLYIMECYAISGDELDKEFYSKLMVDKEMRIEMLNSKRFDRQEDGYIFVSI